MLEVGKDHEIVADKAPQLIGLLMRTLEEFFEQPELVHHLERRGMDGVAAEVAQEIGMLLEHQDVDAGAGEEKAEHHPGWSTAAIAQRVVMVSLRSWFIWGCRRQA